MVAFINSFLSYVLLMLVLTSLLRFNDLFIDEKRIELTKQFMETANSDDLMILLHKKKKLDDLRIRINKELGIVVAK